MNPEYFAQEVAARAKQGIVDRNNSDLSSAVYAAAYAKKNDFTFKSQCRLSNRMLSDLGDHGIELMGVEGKTYQFSIFGLVGLL